MTDPAPLPENIGPYRITGRLGRGGMGEVLSGYDDRLDRPVALKRVHPGGKNPELARQRFRREARVVARLSHPAIVQVHDWVETDDQDWLVMELVDGKPLDAVLAAGPMPPGRAVAIARQVAAGLAAAHQAGLVHRDLKPANLMVTTGDDSVPGGLVPGVKILDFGIAKTIHLETDEATSSQRPTTLTEAGQLIGTVAYMSPEQALGWPVDHRSDLFSLGTLLYEMSTGVPPFQGEAPMQTLNRICSAKEIPLGQLDRQLPESLVRLVQQLLKKEPARRPADALEVLARLDGIEGLLTAHTAGPSSVPEHPTANAQDTTLVAKASPIFADPKDPTSSTTYTTHRLSRWWGLPLLAAAVLIVAGLSGLSSWLGSTMDVVAPAAKPTADTKLTSHALYERGMAALERYDRKGNIDQAMADFQRALAQDEHYAPALAGLSRAYWLDFFSDSQDPQRIDQALAAALRAVELDEYLAIARVSLGMAYSELGRADGAVKELEHALQLEPLNADARFGLSVFYSSQGKTPEALDQIKLAIKAQPGRWYLPARLGNLYLTTGQYVKAEAAFRDSLELAPDNFLSFRNLGVALFYQGELAEAASQFQLALQIQPDPSVYSNLGTIYFAQGLYAQSVSAFSEAIETGGGSNNYLLWANLADAYRWTPDNASQARDAYLRAIQLLREKVDAAPQNQTLRTRLSVYLAKRGDCDQALANIAKLGNLPGDDGQAWARIAVANEVCARREAALVALEKALQAKLAVTEIQENPELLNLRQDVRYHQLVMHLRAVED